MITIYIIYIFNIMIYLLNLLAIFFFYSKFAIADITDNDDFSMNCSKNQIRDTINKKSLFFGKELNDFRLSISGYLNKGKCQKKIYFKESCELNNKWPIDNETYLIQTFCSSGAYLINSAWFFEGHHGVYPISANLPIYRWQFDKNKLINFYSEGFKEISILTNASFNNKNKILKHRTYCCAGDNSYEVSWLLENGIISINKLIVDTVNDGKTSPQLIINYK